MTWVLIIFIFPPLQEDCSTAGGSAGQPVASPGKHRMMVLARRLAGYKARSQLSSRHVILYKYKLNLEL